MTVTIHRFMLAFVAVFAVFAAGIGGYWFFVQRPARACETAGNWWDPENRVCGTVVYIPDLTGRYTIDGRRDAEPTVVPPRAAPAPAQPAS